MRTLLTVLSWLVLLAPAVAQNPIIFSSKKGLVRSGLQGAWALQNPNLFLYSQDFSNAAWTKLNSPGVTTGVSDPLGGTTAIRVTPVAGTTDARIQETIAVSSTSCTMQFWVRSTTGAIPTLLIRDANSPFTVYASLDVNATTTWTKYSITGTVTGSSSVIAYIRTSTTDTAKTFEIAFAQLNEGSTALPYVAVTDAQTYPNLVSGGAALQRGTTSGSDAGDPTRRLVGLVFDGVDDRVSNLPAKGSAWTVTNCSAAHCYTVDSAGGSYVDGAAQAGATEFAVETAGGYTGTLSFLGRWTRVLTPGEIRRNYATYLKPAINAAGGTLP